MRNKKISRLLFLLLLCAWPRLQATCEFVIVTGSFNNEQHCIKYLDAITNQTYPHWSLIYINDCSQDHTGLIVEEYVRTHNLSSKCTIIHNAKRQGAMANIYKAVHLTAPSKIIVCIDGDDRLSDNYVLERLASVYRDKTTWITYGNYKAEPETIKSLCKPFPIAIIKENLFRKFPWTTSHLKTFYAGLFHKIKKKDLCYKDRFVQAASDVAFMMPMLEMASKGHITYIPEVLYIYNYQNPLNDARQRQKEVNDVEKHIRSLTRYKPLHLPPFKIKS